MATSVNRTNSEAASGEKSGPTPPPDRAAQAAAARRVTSSAPRRSSTREPRAEDPPRERVHLSQAERDGAPPSGRSSVTSLTQGFLDNFPWSPRRPQETPIRGPANPQDRIPAPLGLTPAQQRLWEFRDARGAEHVRWHQGMHWPAGRSQESLPDQVHFFDYHRGLVEQDAAERRRLGLPPLGPLTPPATVSLTYPDGTVHTVERPNPADPRYAGDFQRFYDDMMNYHGAYHNANPAIREPRTNVLQDSFYQFHGWIEQQWQSWRRNNQLDAMLIDALCAVPR